MLIHLIQILVFSSFVLLSFIMLSNPLKVNKKANIWFGVFLFLWATFWLDEIIILIKANELDKNVTLVIFFFQFLSPIVLYLCIVFFTNPNYKFKRKDISVFVLPLIYLTLLFIDATTTVKVESILVILLITHGLIYTVISYLKIRKHQKQINLFSSNTFEDLRTLMLGLNPGLLSFYLRLNLDILHLCKYTVKMCFNLLSNILRERFYAF